MCLYVVAGDKLLRDRAGGGCQQHWFLRSRSPPPLPPVALCASFLFWRHSFSFYSLRSLYVHKLIPRFIHSCKDNLLCLCLWCFANTFWLISCTCTNSIQLECYAIQLVFYIYISGLMSQNTTNDPVSVSGLYTSAVMHGYDVTLLCVLVARQNTLNVIKSLVWRGEIVITRDYILVWCIYMCICSSSKVFNNHLHTKGEDEKM